MHSWLADIDMMSGELPDVSLLSSPKIGYYHIGIPLLRILMTPVLQTFLTTRNGTFVKSEPCAGLRIHPVWVSRYQRNTLKTPGSSE
jgi:hypothetical protein